MKGVLVLVKIRATMFKSCSGLTLLKLIVLRNNVAESHFMTKGTSYKKCYKNLEVHKPKAIEAIPIIILSRV